jgi:CRP-like cAMP-binding protein
MRIMAKRTLAQRHYISRLRLLDFFHDSTDSEVAVFLNRAEQKSYSNQQKLITEDQASRYFMVITEGVAIVRQQGEIIQVAGPGDTLGEFGFIRGESSAVSVEAVSSLSVLAVRPSFLTELTPKVHLHFYKRISELLVQKMAVDNLNFMLDIELFEA